MSIGPFQLKHYATCMVNPALNIGHAATLCSLLLHKVVKVKPILLLLYRPIYPTFSSI